MGSLFDEIQQRAEKLNTNVRLGDISEIRLPSASTTQQVEGISGAYASSLEASLDDIFRRSEEIWNRKQSIRPVAGMGPTLRATKDLSQLDSTQLVAAQQQKRKEAEKPIEYEGVSKAMEQGRFEDEEVNKYVQRAFERARIEAERTFLNQQILEKPASATSTLFSPKRQQQQPGMSPQKLDGTIRGRGGIFAHLPRAPLLHEQNVFAQKIDVSLTNNCNELLTQAIREAVKKLNTKEADYIWSKVFAIFPKTTPPQRGRTVREMRSEKQWLDSIIESGTQYLQNEMEAHMEASIEANLARARRGGIPGTLSRIEAYLNVRQAVHPVYEDGLFNSHHPKWAMLFCCLRVGDLQAASRVAETLKNIPQCAALVNILVALPRLTTNIDDDRRIKLRAEWKQSAQGCQDVHKKAVYGLFLGFDSPEANETIEDWLWARLFACKYAPESGRALHQLQTTICAQHGERYFVNEGGSHLLYFAVLLLTGQIERAAHVLFKSEDHRVHGVHIALLAHQLRLLLCTNKVSDDILIQDVHEPSVCQLNLARLVLLYVKDFELSNVNYALNYCFLLRDFQLDPVLESKVTRTVFEACVSRIVFLSGERAAILGQLNQRGERVPGLIDKFSAALNISDVIARVAFDTNVQADPLGACHLYALANRRDDANKLISFQLSQCISNPSQEQTLKAVECAHWLAKRHDRSPEEDAQFATLKLLLDLHTFFLHASEGRHQEAVQTVQQRLRFVPTDPDDVQTAVAHFFLVPEEVRPLLPAICSQLMRSIVALHQAAAPAGSPATLQLKQFAKALILYTAMIPYRFPVSTNSLLLQLQSKIV